MIFALGFFVAGVLALAVAPAFWHRAIRLSTRRLEMQLPLSGEEILAGRDLLRAQFAAERRRLEQKLSALNERHAGAMAELGRTAAVAARQDANLRTLSEQSSEGLEEAAELRRALIETSAELAAAAKDSYDTGGLIARKDAKISDLTARLEDAEAFAARQREALGSLESDSGRQGQAIAAQSAKIEQLEAEVATLRLQHQADQVTLKAAAARVADREVALEASVKREKDLIRHRKLQSEAARAAESGYIEKIERLRSALASAQQALDLSRKTGERLTQELDEMRTALSPEDSAALMRNEENEILRQKINEIGAAIIRAAAGTAAATPDAGAGQSGEPAQTVAEKAPV